MGSDGTQGGERPEARQTSPEQEAAKVEDGTAAAGVANPQSLQRIFNNRAGIQDYADWDKQIEGCRRCICRIEDARDDFKALGTGFLVGPDLVLTNYHVVARYLPAREGDGPMMDVSQLACRFDFSTDLPSPDGFDVAVDSKQPFLSFAPFSSVDVGKAEGLPDPAEADYALMRISRRVGEEDNRGWLHLSNMVPRPSPGDTLIILQHAKGSPMGIGIGVVSQLNGNKTRLLYNTDTEAGASGSPCFNGRLQLVAIHHGSDARGSRLNRGVPIEQILARLPKELKLERPPNWRDLTVPQPNPPTPLPRPPKLPVDWKKWAAIAVVFLVVLGAAGYGLWEWTRWTTLYVTVLARDGSTPVASAKVVAILPGASGPDKVLAERVTNNDGRAALRVAETTFYIRVGYLEAQADVTCLRNFNVALDPPSLNFGTSEPGCTAKTPGRSGDVPLNPPAIIPSWLKVAEGELGQKEFDTGSNPRIEEYHASTTLGRQPQSIPWGCSFVSWVLQQSNVEGNPRSPRCADYRKFGKGMPEPIPGAITVLRPNAGAPEGLSGVAGFLYSADESTVTIIVGNVDNQVSLVTFSRELVQDYRWPASAPCNSDAIKRNIDWLKDNNKPAYEGVVKGCRTMASAPESGAGLAELVASYKGGQSHNPIAAAQIDGCVAEQLLQICDGY